MKTFKTVATSWKKSVVLGALVLAPALTLTPAAQADPRYDGNRNVPRTNSRVHDNRYTTNRGPQFNGAYRPQDTRFDPRRDDNRNDYRSNDYRSNGNRNDRDRFDPRRDDHRNDYRNDRDKKNNTAKIIGAGVLGAILGAVIAR